MKENFLTNVQVQGQGDSKAKAFADALAGVQAAVLKNSGRILLRIEPHEVAVIRAEQRSVTEKFLFFFLPRQKTHYSVLLEVTVNVTAIDSDKVPFTACQSK